jgi:hypothetical protein
MTVRVRKARRTSRLACGHHVQRGQLIASPGRGRWVCIGCQLAAIRAANDVPARQGGGAAQEGTV